MPTRLVGMFALAGMTFVWAVPRQFGTLPLRGRAEGSIAVETIDFKYKEPAMGKGNNSQKNDKKNKKPKKEVKKPETKSTFKTQ